MKVEKVLNTGDVSCFQPSVNIVLFVNIDITFYYCNYDDEVNKVLLIQTKMFF